MVVEVRRQVLPYERVDPGREAPRDVLVAEEAAHDAGVLALDQGVVGSTGAPLCSVDDAVRHGSEALAFHVEGLVDDGEPIPPPRSIDAIKAANWGLVRQLVGAIRDAVIDSRPGACIEIAYQWGILARKSPSRGSPKAP